MKVVGRCIYCHWSCIDPLPATFCTASSILQGREGGLYPKWDYVKWNRETGVFTFVWCRDWDGENEPVVVRMVRVDPVKPHSETVSVSKTNPPIIHGKHLFVREGYTGFDIEKARRRWDSYQGAEWLDKSRMGFLKWWTENAVPKIGR